MNDAHSNIAYMWQNLGGSCQKHDFKIMLVSCDNLESNMCAPLLNLLNLLRTVIKPHIFINLSIFYQLV